jgi:hypothetical protein
VEGDIVSTPKALLKALDLRDGRVCAWHGVACGVDTLVPQHRANRGMGGRASMNRLSNLVWLCEVNSLIESDTEWAIQARILGIKISSHADPDAEPITHAVHGRCFLNDDGTVTSAEKEVA